MKLKNLKEFFELRQNCPFCNSKLDLHSPLGLTFKLNKDVLSIFYNNTASVFCTIIDSYYKSIDVNIITNKITFNRRKGSVFLVENKASALATNCINLERECEICLYRGITRINLSSEEIEFIDPVLIQDQSIIDGYPIYLDYQNNKTYIYGLRGSYRKAFDGIIFDLKDIDSIKERLEILELLC
jgi:hypothetical protein